jgi:hypothetical protein
MIAESIDDEHADTVRRFAGDDARGEHRQQRKKQGAFFGVKLVSITHKFQLFLGLSERKSF